jgi:hypothetical protein
VQYERAIMSSTFYSLFCRNTISSWGDPISFISHLRNKSKG